MRPGLRSQLLAAGVSFVLGFAVANIGLILIQRPDQVLWIVVGAILMATGVFGVLFADTRRRLSWWAVLGAELSLLAVGVPLLWLFSLSLSSSPVTSLWPENADWSAFTHAWSAGKGAALNTVIVTAPAVAAGCVLGALAATATVRGRLPGQKVVSWILLGALFAPAFALAGPMATQAYDFGMFDQRRYLAVCIIAITTPLSWWLFDRIGSTLAWNVRQLLIVDGATLIHRLWLFWARVVLPRAIGVVAIVFIIAAGDVALGFATTASNETMTLPAQLASWNAPSVQTIAAIALWWLVPCIVVAVMCNRMIGDLFKRRSR